jgi:hypothetical protein
VIWNSRTAVSIAVSRRARRRRRFEPFTAKQIGMLHRTAHSATTTGNDHATWKRNSWVVPQHCGVRRAAHRAPEQHGADPATKHRPS